MAELRFLLTFSRWIWRLFAVLVICLAVVVTLGRMAIGQLPELQGQLERQIAEQLGHPVKFKNLAGDWVGLNPVLYLENFAIYLSPKDEVPVIALSHVRAEPDLMASLIHGRLVWRNLRLGKIAVGVLEDAAGGWSVGFDMGSTQGGGVEAIEALLFNSHYIQIDAIESSFRFHSGAESTISFQRVKVENGEGFHRLEAGVSVEGGKEAAQLKVEGWGSPLDWGEFRGAFYLKLNEIRNTGLLRAALDRWLPENFKHIRQMSTDINSEVWFVLDGKGKGQVGGFVEAAELPLNWFQEVEPITDFSAQLSGSYQGGRGWSIGFNKLGFSWGDLSIAPVSLLFQQREGVSWGEGSMAISQIDLALLSNMAEQIGGLPEEAVSAISGLNLRGQVSPLYIDLTVGGEVNNQAGFSVRGNLKDVALDSFRKAPASRDVNGYFEVHAATVGSVEENGGLKGFLELDSPGGISMWYPAAYSDFMVYGATKGRLDWELDHQRKAVIVNSGPIDVSGEDGVGRAYLHLFQPLEKGYGSPEMTLLAGVRESQAKYRDNYLPKTLRKELRQWLDTAVGDADIPEAGFIWRGSLLKAEEARRSIQLYFAVKDGILKFQPDWPELTGLETLLTVDDAAMEGVISKGEILQAELKAIDYVLVPSTPSNPVHLAISGKAEVQVPDALEILFQSPLKENIAALSGWNTSGSSKVDLSLNVPLIKGVEPWISVDARISNGSLADVQQKIKLDRINTLLRYQTDTGLSAKKIDGYLWGESRVTGDLKTEANAMVVKLSGEVGVSRMADNLQLPITPIMHGNSFVETELILPIGNAGEVPLLNIRSQLQGIAIDLPEPLGKASAAKLDTEISVDLGEGGWRYSGYFGEQVFADLVIDGDELKEGFIGIGQAQPEPINGQSYILQGHLPSFDLSAWQAVLERFDTTGNGQSGFLSPFIDLRIEQFAVGDFQLNNVAANGSQNELAQWGFTFSSDLADGKVLLPLGEEPIGLHLTRLSLGFNDSRQAKASQTKEGFLADIDPRQLPVMDIVVDQLLIDGEELGSIGFVMRSSERGAEFSRISGELGHIRLGGSPELDTQLAWYTDGTVHRSDFSGLLRTADLRDVLDHWGFPVFMDSDSSRFIAQLDWDGRPDEFRIQALQGTVSLGVNEGSFYASPAAPADAAIRVVSLFNFANWLKRLRFDFSDIFKKGMSYDEVTGGVSFEQGKMSFEPSLEVKMPSGRMRLSGSADLNTEEIDAGLAMTIPVATNLPWIVALAGGLPAAAGVYVTSKVFEKEVDKLSSFSYSITGPWADPEIAVDKIFSDRSSGSENDKSEGKKQTEVKDKRSPVDSGSDNNSK